ncbi:MAG: cation diffusion facilitator family transporter [Oscillospiraceae bacterium]|nr:cation diffusion facilitator family transporter [Oscillospiraceae bacterium]
MTKLLIKLFVGKKGGAENPEARRAFGALSGVTGVVVNLLLFALKLFIGIISGSISVMADAFNNLSDCMSSIVTLAGFRIAGSPADTEHPFGHGRAEYVATLVVSILIIFAGFELAQSAVGKIGKDAELEVGVLSMTILAVSVIAKLWLGVFYRKIGKIIGSGTLRAVAADSRMDVISTLSVMLGGGIFLVFGVNIDAYIGLLVALFVLYTGIRAAGECLTPLLGSAPDSRLVREVEETVMSFDGILGIHDLLVHNYGVGRSVISLHAEVSEEMEFVAAHELVDGIEARLREKFHCEATIHADPVKRKGD